MAYGEGTFTYGYDAADRQTLVVNPASKSFTLTLDAVGREVLKRYANGASTTQAFDKAGNVLAITNRAAVGGLATTLGYDYDPVNRRTRQAESDGATTTWEYDPAGQLTRERRTVTLGTLTASTEPPGFDVSYQYDPAGNRTLQNDLARTATTSYAYTYADRLTRAVESATAGGVTTTTTTTYAHDAAGNRTLKADPAVSTYFDWTAAGQMKCVRSTNHIFNPPP